MKKKKFKVLLYMSLLGFILLNIINFNHAYKFMHYSESSNTSQIEIPKDVLTTTKMLLLGADIPRPKNTDLPSFPYQTKKICNDEIECWISDNPEQKNLGTVLIFHGYVASKDSMLDRADCFYDLGYKVVLADFKGGGGSRGNSVELGYGEADQVAYIFKYFNKEAPLYLYGCSMGSVAIMRAISKHKIKPKAILLECPFGTLYETVVSRFQFMNIPSFPFAGILLFWGSIQNGFNGWDHNCYDYAKDIKVPTLLMLGDKDPFVSKKEIDKIYDNLTGKKYLKTFPNSGHESYLKHDSLEWKNRITEFLKEDVYCKNIN